MASPLKLNFKLILVESDTMDFSMHELSKSLFYLQKLEIFFLDKGLNITFKYEDTTSSTRNHIPIKNFEDYKRALCHSNAQGLVLIVEKENHVAKLIQDKWKCKHCFSVITPDATNVYHVKGCLM